MAPNLREIVGEEAFAKIIAEHGGERIPKNYDRAEDFKQKYIFDLYSQRKEENKSQAEILRELSQQFFLSEVRIFQIIQKLSNK